MHVEYKAKVECVIQGQRREAGEVFTAPAIAGGHKHLEVVKKDAPTPAGPVAPLKTPEQIAAAPAAQVFKPRKANKSEPITSFLD